LTCLGTFCRPTGGEAAIDQLAPVAQTNTTHDMIPPAAYWARDEQMTVFKNADREPILWQSDPISKVGNR